MTAPAATEPGLVAGSSLWADAWKRLRRNRLAVASGVVILLFAAACLVGPGLIAATWGYDEATQDLAYGPRPPSWDHPFGTDFYGRDLLVRVLAGGRVSLSVGLLAAVVAATIGTVYGAIASYAGGVVDAVMMRAVDILYALPTDRAALTNTYSYKSLLTQPVAIHIARIGPDRPTPSLDIKGPIDVSRAGIIQTSFATGAMLLLIAIGGGGREWHRARRRRRACQRRRRQQWRRPHAGGRRAGAGGRRGRAGPGAARLVALPPAPAGGRSKGR